MTTAEVKNLPLPKSYAITYVPYAGSSKAGLKLLSGAAKIVATRMAEGEVPRREAASVVLEHLHDEVSFKVYVGPKDLAETIASHLAASLANWAEENARSIQTKPSFFTIEVDHDK